MNFLSFGTAMVYLRASQHHRNFCWHASPVGWAFNIFMPPQEEPEFAIGLWTWGFPSLFLFLFPSFFSNFHGTGYHPMRTTQKAKLIPQCQPYLFVASSFSSWLTAENPACLQDRPQVSWHCQIKSFPGKTSSSMSSVPCLLLCAPIVDSCVCTGGTEGWGTPAWNDAAAFGHWIGGWFQTQEWRRVDFWWSAWGASFYPPSTTD